MLEPYGAQAEPFTAPASIYHALPSLAHLRRAAAIAVNAGIEEYLPAEAQELWTGKIGRG